MTLKKPAPFKPQYRWFIVSPNGEVCWPVGMSRQHAISFFMDHSSNAMEAWKHQQAAGYTCRRLRIGEA